MDPVQIISDVSQVWVARGRTKVESLAKGREEK